MNIVCIIQARMNSSRLPGKTMIDINGANLLDRVFNRVKLSKLINSFSIATTNNECDNVIENFAIDRSISCYRGKENDVLNRFYECAKQNNADIVVRVTADDPLKDSRIIDKAITIFKSSSNIDYVSNTIIPTFPEGLDIEVFNFQSLEIANKKALKRSEREHVTPYIWKNSNIFNLKNFTMNPNLSHWRWTVDNANDVEFVTAIYKHFGDKIDFTHNEIIEYINSFPALMRINSGTIRNQGYLKSVSDD